MKNKLIYISPVCEQEALDFEKPVLTGSPDYDGTISNPFENTPDETDW